ncbi:LysR family transcriptional regulator [Cryobacterium sp. N22]|uniref:LysR family transcriptional regulator n=1 Tax=Cryobacterium sp. N22 TaxID=2048290 RepID=UPI000CE4E6A6|nr:LysR family transcriptional regulator [Cryobacterium sp. N22]
MTSPSLDHFRTFVTVYRAGSLTEAASLLGMSQPTATAHIHALETQLGYSLFTRTRSGVIPTQKAAQLAREVAGHIDALDDISSLGTENESTARTVYIGGPAELLTTVVLPRLETVSRRAASQINVTFGLAAELLEGLRAGRLDVVISSIRPRVQGVESTPLFDEIFALVGAPRWAGVDHALESLVNIPVVVFDHDLPIVRRYWRTVFQQGPSELSVAAVIPDLRGIREAVVSGIGMSVLPLYLIAEELRAGTLVVLFEPVMPPLNTVYLAVRAGESVRNADVISQLRQTIEWAGEIT